MGGLDLHSARVRQGLRRARQAGAVLGGLRPARQQANQLAHAEALQAALAYREILVAGQDKSLAAMSRDLLAAGCRTGSGRPLSPEAVRRLRARLQEALQAVAAGTLEDESAEWLPEYEIRVAVHERNAVALRWLLRMARKEYGDNFADWLMQPWLGSDRAAWVREALDAP
jgi:hypothetical protein